MREFFEFEDDFDIDESLNKELDEGLFGVEHINQDDDYSSDDKSHNSIPFTLEELKALKEIIELENLVDEHDEKSNFEIPDISDIEPIDEDLYIQEFSEMKTRR